MVSPQRVVFIRNQRTSELPQLAALVETLKHTTENVFVTYIRLVVLSVRDVW